MGLAPSDVPITAANAYEPSFWGQGIHVSQLPAAPAPTSSRYMDVRLPSLPSASATRAGDSSGESLGLNFNTSEPLEPLQFPAVDSPSEEAYTYSGDTWDVPGEYDDLWALILPSQETGEPTDADRPDAGV